MGSAVAQVLPLAIGVVASPLPIIAVILILVGPSGRAKAMSFLAGWLAGILVVGLIGVLLVNQASGSSSDGYWTAGTSRRHRPRRSGSLLSRTNARYLPYQRFL